MMEIITREPWFTKSRYNIKFNLQDHDKTIKSILSRVKMTSLKKSIDIHKTFCKHL